MSLCHYFIPPLCKDLLEKLCLYTSSKSVTYISAQHPITFLPLFFYVYPSKFCYFSTVTSVIFSDCLHLLKREANLWPIQIFSNKVYLLIYIFSSLVALLKLKYTCEIFTVSKQNLCLLDLFSLPWYIDLKMYFSHFPYPAASFVRLTWYFLLDVSFFILLYILFSMLFSLLLGYFSPLHILS